MKIEFYEKEVERLQIKFNRIFGTQPACNLGERYTAIMGICWLSVLSMKIKSNPTNSELVKEFIKARNILNKYFNHKERSKANVEYATKGAVGEDPEVVRDRACQHQG